MFLFFKKTIKPILQTTPTECGAACLAMLSQYYGRYISLQECNDLLSPGREGTNARTLIHYGRELGFRISAYSIDITEIREIDLPAIIHWKFNHYLILEKISNKKFHVVDPAKGRKVLSQKTFRENFTGVVFVFEKEIHFEKKSSPSTVKKWVNYLNPYLSNSKVKSILIKTLVVSFIIQVFGLLVPLLTMIIVDDILPNKLNGQILTIIGICIVLVVVTRLIIDYLRSILSLYLQKQYESLLTAGVFSHLVKLPYSFFRDKNSGDLITRVESNRWLGNLITSQFISTIIDGILVLVYLVALLMLSPLLFLICIGLGLIHLTLVWSTANKTKGLVEEHLLSEAKLSSYQIELLRGIATVIATGANNRVFKKWYELFNIQLNSLLRKDHFFSVIQSIRSAMGLLAPLLLLWVGIILVLNGTLTIGTMLAANALAISFLTPFVALVNSLRNLQEGDEHLNRVYSILNEDKEHTGKSTIKNLRGELKLKNVSFRYDKNGEYLIDHVSATVLPGQKVAIVGASGVGKTTIGKMLVGLISPDEGHILYDNINIKDLDIVSFRQQIGVVLQDSFLFFGSIRENISFNNDKLSFDEMVHAAKQACIHDDIIQMPMGYDTIIAENGASLSGGQIQRIALARALAQKPKILLLDEATSHLDANTEQKIERMLSSLSCTRIHIAHRLSTVIDADNIFILSREHGLQQGTHDELLMLNEEYQQLVNNQFFVSK